MLLSNSRKLSAAQKKKIYIYLNYSEQNKWGVMMVVAQPYLQVKLRQVIHIVELSFSFLFLS